MARRYVKEEWSDRALELREDFRSKKLGLLSPRLLLCEVANGLRYSPELSPREILEGLESLINMQIDLIEFDLQQWRSATQNALALQISVYDSAYYTAAESYSMKLITADRRLFKKVGDKNSIFLKDYDYELA